MPTSSTALSAVFSAQRHAYPAKLIALTVLYVLSSKIGLFVEVEYGGITAIWPPSGIALAVFLRGGLRYWPMVIVGEFFIAMTIGQPIVAGLIGGAAQLTETALIWFLLTTRGITKITASPRALLTFALLGATLPLTAAFIGATTLRYLGLLQPADYFSGVVTWWLGDATGLILLTPFLADLRSWPFANRRAFFGYCTLMAIMIATGAAIILPGTWISTYLYFILVPFVAIAAFSFGLVGAGSATIILTSLVFTTYPLVRQNDVVTAIHMAFAATCAFTGYLMTALAEKRTLDQQVISKQNTYLNTLHDLVIGLIDQLDTDRLVQLIVGRACNLLNVDSAYFYQQESGSDRIVVTSGQGLYHHHVGYKVAPGEGVAGTVWQHGIPTLVNHYAKSPLRHPDRIWDAVSAIIGVPIRLDNTIIGVLGIASTEPGRIFTDDDLKITEQFGELVSVAWKNAAVHTQLSVQLNAKEKAEQALAISEQTYREIFNSTSEAMIVIDPLDGRILEANRAAEILFGFQTDGQPNNLASLLATGIEPHRTAELIKCCLEIGPQAFEWYGMTHENESNWLEIALKEAAVQGQSCILAVIRCIDERKMAEANLLQLQTAIDHTAEDIVITDVNGTIRYVNPAFERHTGYDKSEALGKTPSLLKSGVHNDAFYRNMWQTILSGNVWSGHLQNRRKDGTVLLQETSIAPFFDSDNKIKGFVSVKRDITEHEQIKRQLEQAQKMEAVGTMASGIAHDFNNILGVINGYAEVALRRHVPAGHPAVHSLQEILRAGQRAADLVRQILIFSQSSEIELKRIDVLSIAKEVCKSLGATLPAAISLTFNCPAERTQILATPSFIHQVILNLLTNAIQAIGEERGTITLELTNEACTNVSAASEPFRQQTEYLNVTISDNGCGMTSDTLEKIFDPYFTTKGAGRGTGLGLSVVHGIVKKLGGFVRVDSEPGKGSRFQILVPVNEGSATAFEEEILASPTGTETILLVDDNEVLTDVGREMLELQGYTVAVCNDGAQAFADVAATPDRYDLVMTDHLMPGMTGIQLSKLIRETAPDIPIILCTGDPSTLNQQELDALAIRDVIAKPLSITELALVIRQALDRK